ncbi:hypothetical protein JIR001_25560 [Polycladomyces abyssicola]|uniref:Uncharacterized protein n=1 Tax=Polycladomyces abyssicola TaxID=1125966 RepID=A0A8D5ZPX4_9BACL|nr:hypothetical protein [Polycladomyces abyssicola]BCU82773.1 hypothetical protein JIR001_25560 [Polycladomyces abyssicola]
MNDWWKRWFRSVLTYLIIAVVTVLLMIYYEQAQTKNYIDDYRRLGGSKVINDISDTYKLIIEQYSNYKLNRELKIKIVDRLKRLSAQLQEVDERINTREVDRRVDFSFVYHDIKLVNLALSDSSKDDIVPVIVLHAMEGLGELKREIIYIRYH